MIATTLSLQWCLYNCTVSYQLYAAFTLLATFLCRQSLLSAQKDRQWFLYSTCMHRVTDPCPSTHSGKGLTANFSSVHKLCKLWAGWTKSWNMTTMQYDNYAI